MPLIHLMKNRTGRMRVAGALASVAFLAACILYSRVVVQVHVGDYMHLGNYQQLIPMTGSARGQAVSSPPIPRSMFFTYKYNMLVTKEPAHLYENVMHTIAEYRKAWDDPAARVSFLDDDLCRDRIREAEPRLVRYFNGETSGMFRGDICRVAALYLAGGYYFDVDLRVVQPLILADNVTFASVREAVVQLNCDGAKCPPKHKLDVVRKRHGFYPYGKNNLFQAFIASSPANPVLKRAMDLMVDHYEDRYEVHGNMGVSTLGDALADVLSAESSSPSSLSIGTVRLLEETKNEPHMGETRYYPDLIPQDGRGMGCKKICHDPIERKVYFFSRIPGYSSTCLFTNDNSTTVKPVKGGGVAVV